MSVLRRPPKEIDHDVVYVCLSGHVSPAGSFREGTRLRGSHPGVLAAQNLWADASLDDEQMAAVMAERGLLTPRYKQRS